MKSASTVAFLKQIDVRDLGEELQKACEAHGATPEEVGGRSRVRHVVRARAAFVCALRERGWSYPAIGTLLGRDHSGIIYLERVGRPTEEAAAGVSR